MWKDRLSGPRYCNHAETLQGRESLGELHGVTRIVSEDATITVLLVMWSECILSILVLIVFCILCFVLKNLGGGGGAQFFCEGLGGCSSLL